MVHWIHKLKESLDLIHKSLQNKSHGNSDFHTTSPITEIVWIQNKYLPILTSFSRLTGYIEPNEKTNSNDCPTNSAIPLSIIYRIQLSKSKRYIHNLKKSVVPLSGYKQSTDTSQRRKVATSHGGSIGTTGEVITLPVFWNLIS